MVGAFMVAIMSSFKRTKIAKMRARVRRLAARHGAPETRPALAQPFQVRFRPVSVWIQPPFGPER